MKALYLTGPDRDRDIDRHVTAQLSRGPAPLEIIAMPGAAEVLAEIRRATGIHALIISPDVTQNETLALITSLRRDRVPIAIVPVLREAQQDFFAAAVAAGADDVLVVRGETLVKVAEVLTRIRQSPYLYPAEERRRLRVLYAGRDQLVLNLLQQVPFVSVERVSCGIDGACPVRTPDANDGAPRCDAVVIDEHPGDAHPLQVLKSVKAQASDLPVIVLTPAGPNDVSAAALDLGADDTVLKSGIFRRRLIATLRRLHQRLEFAARHTALHEREARLRQIVEGVPTGIAVVAANGSVLAMNAACLTLVGATQPREVVGRDIRSFVEGDDSHRAMTELLRLVTRGESGDVELVGRALDGTHRALRVKGVMLERHARGGRGMIASIVPVETAADAASRAAGEIERAQASLQDLERRYADLERTAAEDRARWDDERRALEMRVEAADAAARESHAEVSEERERLRASLRDAEQRFAAAEDARQAERDAWTAERTALLAKVADVEAAAAAAARLQSTLEAVQAELHHSNEAHHAERDAWDAARRDLEQARAEALAGRADLEATLAAAKAALGEAIARHQADRRDWETARHDLEGRLTASVDGSSAIQTGLSAELEAVRAELQRTGETLETERWAWSTERQALETDLENARRAAQSVSRLEEGLSAAREELRLAVEAHSMERAGWKAEREQLDERLLAADAALAATTDLEQQLADARRQQAASDEAFAAERTRWREDREQLETEMEAVRLAAGRLGELENSLAVADDERRVIERQHRHDREEWDRERADLEEELRHLRTTLATFDDLERRLAIVDDERRAVEAQHRQERERWDGQRDALEADLREARASLDALAGLEQDLTAARLELARALEARAADEAAWQTRRTEYEAGYAALLQSSADERAAAEQDRRQLDALRDSLDDERARREIAQRLLEQNAREADERLDAARAEHRLTVEALETQLHDALARIDHLVEDHRELEARFERERATLAADYRRIVDSSVFGYAVTTLEGQLVRCNDSFARLFGYADARDAIDRAATLGIPDLAGRAAVEARLLAERHVSGVDSCLERVDGSGIRVLESAAILPTRSDGELLVERFMVDMSAMAVLEDRLREAQRLEEVGAVAAAMVPRIEAVVAEIEAASRTIQTRLASRGEPGGDTDQLISNAGEVAALVRQLSSFSRRQSRTPEPVGLNEVLEREEPVFRRLVGGHVEFELRPGPPATLAVDEEDLDQLLTSLVIAGRDLLPLGGALLLETRRADEADETEPAAGRATVLALRASGYGVLAPPALPAVDQLARRCGGRLHVHIETGVASELSVAFPRCLRPRPSDEGHVSRDSPRSTRTW